MMDDFKRPPAKRPVRIDSLEDNRFPGSSIGSIVRPTGSQTSPIPDASSSYSTQPISDPSDHAAPEAAGSPKFLPPLEHHAEIAEHATPEPQKRSLFRFKKPDCSRKQWIIVGLSAVLLIGSGTAFALTREKPKPVVKKAPAVVAPAPAPKPILSPLSGLPVTAEQQSRPVTGVMIENSNNARPQSSLDQAGVVFEAIAEYGITRFLALYQENNPEVVGPVRSARPYFLDWAMAFDANYAHVGGSPEALQLIRDHGMRDLDQFHNAGAYRRVSHRFAPHNMYTSLNALVDAGKAKGYATSTFTPLVRKEKEEPSKAPTASKIDLNISSPQCNVHYDYDAATNSYKRVMAGVPHTDAETAAQLNPKVVIALGIPYSIKPNGLHSHYETVGSGNMLLFQDGTVTTGTWSKTGPKEQFIFKDGTGADMKLNPGQTWVTVLDDITKATYTP